jgi:twitching motility protein PilT
MDLIELLKFVTKKEASDLHLKPGRPPLLRLSGRLVPLKTDPLTPKEIEDMVLPILTPYQRDKLQQNYAVDIGYGVTGVARFRGNIYLQRGSWTAVFRRIPFVIPSLADLDLALAAGEIRGPRAARAWLAARAGVGKRPPRLVP